MIHGTLQSEIGFLTLAFYCYMFLLLPQNFLMKWVYQHIGNNPASAVLHHYFVNMTGELFDVTSRADLLCFGKEIVMLIILLFNG
jgi:hypothetical protein